MTEYYTAYTLVDITETKVVKSKDSQTLQYNQQQNLNTLIQTIGLRSQPIDPIISVHMTQDIVDYGFGKQFQGLHTVWQLDFSVEHTNVFNYNNNKLYHLINDSDGIAIITNLEETSELKTKCFETTNANLINLYFKKTMYTI